MIIVNLLIKYLCTVN